MLLHGARVHTVDADWFKEFFNELFALTAENVPTVQLRLVKLGLRLPHAAD